MTSTPPSFADSKPNGHPANVSVEPARWVWILLFFALVLWLDLPLVRSVYGFGDDFVLFFSESPQEGAFLADGRPIFAAAQYYLHRHATLLSNLGWYRLFCGLGYAGVGAIFIGLLARFGGGLFERVAAALALVTLPCIQTYVASAVTWLSPYAGMSAMAAAMVTFSIDGDGDSVVKRSMQRFLAAGLMLIPTLTYQPMLSWYWVVVFVFLLDHRFLTSESYRRRVVVTIFSGLIYLVFCFAAMKLFFAVSEVAAKSRLELTNDPLLKGYWFLRIQLPQAFNLWRLMTVPSGVSSLLSAAAIMGVVAVGVVASLKQSDPPSNDSPKRVGVSLSWIGLLIFVFLMTHLHWLVIRDIPQSYRIIAPMGAAAWVAVYWAAMRSVQLWVPAELRNRVRTVLTVGTAVFGFAVAQYYNDVYWIEPQRVAYRVLLHDIREQVKPTTEQIHVIRQSESDGLVPTTFIECFNRPAFERFWMIGDLVRLGLRDSGVQHSVRTVTNGSADEAIPEGPNVVVFDTREISSYRYGRRESRLDPKPIKSAGPLSP